MSDHIVSAFDKELEAISSDIAKMGGLGEEQLANALEALTNSDLQLAKDTILADRKIDAIEKDVEHRALRLLALRQPMALDLRETIGAIKISADLERIGDQAKNIAKRVDVLASDDLSKPIQGILRMGRVTLQLLKEVLDAYSQRDANKALSVWRRDEEIDEIYNSVFRELLTYMMEDPRTITMCTHLLFIAKNLERIGDHATNVAERIHFLVEGTQLDEDRPKHDITPSVTGSSSNKVGER